MTCYYGVVCILLYSFKKIRFLTWFLEASSNTLMGHKGRFQNKCLKWCCDMLWWCGLSRQANPQYTSGKQVYTCDGFFWWCPREGMLQYKRFLILFQKLFKRRVFQLSKFSYGVCHHNIVFPFAMFQNTWKSNLVKGSELNACDKMFKIALPTTILICRLKVH
jgi:hypothetical protein